MALSNRRPLAPGKPHIARRFGAWFVLRYRRQGWNVFMSVGATPAEAWREFQTGHPHQVVLRRCDVWSPSA